jgi:hypothetical protein
MWSDPIVIKLHRIRERHAREFGYDLQRMFRSLKEEQESSGRRVVALSRTRTASTRTFSKTART